MRSARARAMRMPAATVLAAAAGIGLVLAADPTSDAGIWLPPCPLRALTGLDCPGCGGTRAVWSLLHGDLPAAVHHNALALVLAPLALCAWGAWAAGRWRGAPVRAWPRWRHTPLALLALAGGWALLRNLPFPPFTAFYV